MDIVLTNKEKAKLTYDALERRRKKKIKQNRNEYMQFYCYKAEATQRCKGRS